MHNEEGGEEDDTGTSESGGGEEEENGFQCSIGTIERTCICHEKELQKKKTPKKTPSENKEVTGSAPSVADMVNQLGEEPGRLEETPAVSGRDASLKLKAAAMKVVAAKRVNTKRIDKGQLNSSLSRERGAPKKKMSKFKWGQVDRDELSVSALQ